MASSTTVRTTLEERLQSVERRLRTQRRLSGLFAILCATLALVSAQRPQKPPILTVSEIEVVDGDGRIAARLGYSTTGGLLEILGPANRVAISASATPSGGSLTVNNRKEGVGTRIFNGVNGGQFTLRQANGQPAVSLSATLAGGQASVHARDGKLVGQLRADQRGRGEVEILYPAERGNKALKF